MQRHKSTLIRPEPAVFLACAAGWFFAAGAVCAQPVPDSSAANRVEVKAGDLHLTLETTPGGARLLSLTDAVGGQELLAEEPLPLFSATVRDTRTGELLTMSADSGWRQADVSGPDATGGFRLTWAAPADERLQGIRITATLNPQDSESALAWDLQIVNESPERGLWHVVFPQVAIRDLGQAGRVFVPITAGVELADLWSKANKKGGTYPSGWTCMQYLAAYNETTRTGLYTGVHVQPLG